METTGSENQKSESNFRLKRDHNRHDATCCKCGVKVKAGAGWLYRYSEYKRKVRCGDCGQEYQD